MILKKYLPASLILIMGAGALKAQNIKFLESNLVRINDSLYVHKYEVSNAEYKEFYSTNKKEELYPDTTTWEMVRDKVKPFTGSYYTNPQFDRYPVVSVNHKQAYDYCEWLTKMYNAFPAKKYKKVKFRLPSEEEWLQAARGAQPEHAWFPWKGNSIRLNDNKRMANYMALDDACIKSTVLDSHLKFMCFDEALKQCFLEAVTTYAQTPFGVHNICGNAAEMTTDEAAPKGGCWLSSGYYLRLNLEKDEQLPIPSPMVGFRVFMDVVEQ